jgi:hypothetical protein
MVSPGNSIFGGTGYFPLMAFAFPPQFESNSKEIIAKTARFFVFICSSPAKKCPQTTTMQAKNR